MGVRRRWRLWLGAGLVAIVGAVLWWWRPAGLVVMPVPSPNGYDALVAAGRMVTGTLPGGKGPIEAASDDELRAYVEANGPALERAEMGFEQESVVPLGRGVTLETHLEGLGPLRALSRVLVCQAVLARREGRTGDAVGACRKLLRLSTAASRGGLLLDRSLGVALEGAALGELGGPLLERLRGEQARSVIAEIEELRRKREPIGRVADRDLGFAMARQGTSARVMFLLSRGTANRVRQPATRAVEASVQRVERQETVLLDRLAARGEGVNAPAMLETTEPAGGGASR